MLTVLLLIVLLILAVMYVILAMKARQQRKEFEFLKEESEKELDSHIRKEVAYQAENFNLQSQLEDAYTSLNLALGANPGPFDHVVTELGVHGVIYQFNNNKEMQS